MNLWLRSFQINKELALKALDKIKAEPSNWCQWAWAKKTNCGTSHCFAGHVVHIAYSEAKPVFEGCNHTGLYTLDGKKYTYKNEARKLLGLDERETNLLFDSYNTLEELESLVNQ